MEVFEGFNQWGIVFLVRRGVEGVIGLGDVDGGAGFGIAVVFVEKFEALIDD